MSGEFCRTEMLIGTTAMETLKKSSVLLFGVGGVGGYVAEALARCGIGHIALVDNDMVSVSNINRQLAATHDTVGQLKVEVVKRRILSINPSCRVEVYPEFCLPENSDKFFEADWDYVVDAIDTVTAKLDIACKAQKRGFSIISSMGTGNKLDPSRLEITDIYKTSVCPLARVMRRELKARGIRQLKVLYSREEPKKVDFSENLPVGKRQIPGSIAFVPSVAGLLIAGEVVRDLIKAED